jgi:hypothetical protein
LSTSIELSKSSSSSANAAPINAIFSLPNR